MASPSSSINLPLQGSILRTKTNFLGQKQKSHKPPTFSGTKHHFPPLNAKFNLSEILGGRGLCNGEIGIEQELKKTIDQDEQSSESEPGGSEKESAPEVQENAFDKELMGLTGGFPGGEKGLQKFITENPPPKKQQIQDSVENVTSKNMKAPQLPLLMPGMIALVNSPNSPYHMMCGIVQRITDGKAGVLFEGGNWDRLITFRLEELERREKGPPMKSPRSVILETMVDNNNSN